MDIRAQYTTPNIGIGVHSGSVAWEAEALETGKSSRGKLFHLEQRGSRGFLPTLWGRCRDRNKNER